MLSKANWAYSQKELGRVSHSCSHSQPHQAIASVVLTVMLTGPLLWQFNSLHDTKSPTSLLGLFSATTVNWISSQGVSVPKPGKWLHMQTGSVNGTTFTAFLAHETGCSIASLCSEGSFLGREELTPAKSSAATCKQETTLDLSLPSAKSEKLGKAKATASVNHWLLKNLHQASSFSQLGFFFDTVWSFFYGV